MKLVPLFKRKKLGGHLIFFIFWSSLSETEYCFRQTETGAVTHRTICRRFFFVVGEALSTFGLLIQVVGHQSINNDASFSARPGASQPCDWHGFEKKEEKKTRKKK